MKTILTILIFFWWFFAEVIVNRDSMKKLYIFKSFSITL